MLRPKTMTYAAGLAAVVALAGCSTEGGAGTPATSVAVGTSSTPAATTSSSSAKLPDAEPTFPPGLPDAAKQKTKAGAKAFVEHFVDQVNSAWRKPSPEQIRDLCSEQSESCAGYVSLAEELDTEKHRYESDAVRIEQLINLADANGLSRLFATIEVLGASVVQEDGTVVSRDTAETVKNMFFLSWGKTGWTVHEVRNA